MKTHTTTGASRPSLGRRDQLIGVAFGLWLIAGLFLDGWAHDDGQLESFFTPWHAVLYSGFAAASAAALYVAARDRQPGVDWRATLPIGHGLTLVGLAVFAAGAAGDLVWHETLGIEVGLEALLSPTHLLLLTGGLMALSAPLRTAWSSPDPRDEDLTSFLPTILAVVLLVSLAGFFLLYLSPFLNDAAGTAFERPAEALHDHPASEVGELQQIMGIASIITATVLVTSAMNLLLRRWTPPAGTFTVLVGTLVAFMVALDQFSQPALLVIGVVAGWLADRARARVPDWALGGVAAAGLWLSYFALYQLTESDGVAWTAELWVGATVLAVLVGVGLGVITLFPVPPAARVERGPEAVADSAPGRP